MARGSTKRLRRSWIRQRRLVVSVLAVPVLLAMGVVGSTWSTEFDPTSGEAGSDEGVAIESPVEVDFPIVFAILLIGFLVLLLYVLLRAKGLKWIVLVCLMFGGIAMLGLLGGALDREDNAPVAEIGTDVAEERPVVSASEPPWSLVIVMVSIAIAGCVAIVARARYDEDESEGELSEEVERLGDELALAGGSPRANIITVYASLERLLGRSGHRRDPSETTAEFSSRTLAELGASAVSCTELAALYQDVAFREREATVVDQERAADLLRSVSVDLGTADTQGASMAGGDQHGQ